MDMASTDKLLTTTRSVRRRLDFSRPIPSETIMECIRLAAQAPSGSNRQSWHFLVVMDEAKRQRIGEYYRRSFEIYREGGPPGLTPAQASDVPTYERVMSSSEYLAQNIQRAPVMIIPCIDGRVEDAGLMRQAVLYGSILPATWSLMLALRSRGIGAAWTTLHLRFEREVAALLNIPDNVTQAALLPVAYYMGDDFKPARRYPPEKVTYWDEWGITQ